MDTTWLTVEEGVLLSGYHPDHLRRLIRAGDVVALKKGNAWWVQRDSLEAYLDAARQSDDKRRGPKQED